MSSKIGLRISMQVFGQSHSDGLGVVIDGLPAGEAIDLDEIAAFLDRRRGGDAVYSTSRAESDAPEILSGVVNGLTCGAPLCAVFRNKNVRKGDYSGAFRPSHADYTAFVKHHGYQDPTGGGHFSGRLTLPICFAGAVCAQILARRGVTVSANIHAIGGVNDVSAFDETMSAATREGDSVGGIIACEIDGMSAGYGDPMFDGVESRLSAALFGIPSVKGVEFGAGFAITHMRGSHANDAFMLDNGVVRTRTNHSGGVQGGITNGMPIIFRVAIKPTPSIARAQNTLDFSSGEMRESVIDGRHDACIVPRAVPCVEAVAAFVMCDMLVGGM